MQNANDRGPSRRVSLSEGGGEAAWSWNTSTFWMFNENRKYACFFTQNASRVLTIVRQSVRHTAILCQNDASYKITRSSLWAAPTTLVCRNKISCPWVTGFPSNEGVKKGYPLKDVILPLLVHIVWIRLQIGTDMLLIVISTGDRLFRFTNINDLERPLTPPPK